MFADKLTMPVINGAILLLFLLPLSKAQTLEKPEWKVGDKWKLEVSLYNHLNYVIARSDGTSPPPSIRARYNIYVMIIDKVKHDGSDCWKLEFVPGEEAPPKIRQMKYQLLVSQDSGVLKEMKAIRRDKEKKSAKKLRLKRIQGLNLRMEEEKGFPLTVIPWGQKPRKLTAEEKSKNRYWTVSVEKEI